jgi:hypothetical protein
MRKSSQMNGVDFAPARIGYRDPSRIRAPLRKGHCYGLRPSVPASSLRTKRFAWRLLASCLCFLFYFSRCRPRRRVKKCMGHRIFPGMSRRVSAQGPGRARGMSSIFSKISEVFAGYEQCSSCRWPHRLQPQRRRPAKSSGNCCPLSSTTVPDQRAATVLVEFSKHIGVDIFKQPEPTSVPNVGAR